MTDIIPTTAGLSPEEIAKVTATWTSRQDTFWYRLLFTRDDDLDVLQLLFIVMIGVFIVAFFGDALKVLDVSTVAWTTFGSVFFILALSGTPTNVAKIIADSKAADVLSTISKAPNVWKDDERDPSWPKA